MVERIPTPGDCADGFFEAFWRRPEALLDPRSADPSRCGLCFPPVSSSASWTGSPQRSTLASGMQQHGYLRALDSFDGALRLVVSNPD